MFAVRLVQEETVKTGFCHESVCKPKCLQARKHVPIGGKRHHTNQSQNYMANHVIWLLRNRGSCGRDGGGRVTAAVMVIGTAIVIFAS